MALIVDFDASESTPGEGETIVSYVWDWGDGAPSGSNITTSHTYASPGDYNVSLTVTNSCGRTDTSIQCVRVTPSTKIVTFDSVPADANIEILS